MVHRVCANPLCRSGFGRSRIGSASCLSTILRAIHSPVNPRISVPQAAVAPATFGTDTRSCNALQILAPMVSVTTGISGTKNRVFTQVGSAPVPVLDLVAVDLAPVATRRLAEDAPLFRGSRTYSILLVRCPQATAMASQ